MRAVSGMRNLLSSTTRNGCRPVVDIAHIQSRIVRQHGADAGQHRAGTRAPVLHIQPCRLAGDPLADPVRQRGAAVQARSRSCCAARACRASCARRNPMFSSRAAASIRPHVDRDAGRTQFRDALRLPPADSGPAPPPPRARHPPRSAHRRRAGCGRDGCTAPASHKRLRRAPPRRLRAAQGLRHGLRRHARCQPSPTTSPSAHQHAADTRIRAGGVQTAFRQPQCLRHPLTLSCAVEHRLMASALGVPACRATCAPLRPLR